MKPNPSPPRVHRAPAERRADDIRRDLNRALRESQQIIASVIFLRARHTTSPEARRLANACWLSVCALGAASAGHDVAGSDDRIDFGLALQRISNEIDAMYGRRGIGLRCHVDTVSVTVPDAQHLALLTLELVSNAYEHAFVRRRFGAVEVGMHHTGRNRAILWVADNGIGFTTGRMFKCRGAGWKLIDAFARTLGADVTIANAHPGTRVEVSFRTA
jgi:two-component system, sensor histidine kinase PdtaS